MADEQRREIWRRLFGDRPRDPVPLLIIHIEELPAVPIPPPGELLAELLIRGRSPGFDVLDPLQRRDPPQETRKEDQDGDTARDRGGAEH